jgi:hypothetical protein
VKISEIISEVLDITGTAPETKWHNDTSNDITTGKWVDPSGKDIKITYRPTWPGTVKVDFSRDQNGHNRRDITGTGGAATPKILTGVIQNLKNYLDTNPNIHTLYFTSLDPSRTKAYSRMVDRLAPEAGLVGTRTDNVIGGTGFSLTRAQPGQQHVPLVQKQAGALATPTIKAPAAPSVTPPAAATKLPLPQGRAIPNPLLNKALTPSIAGSHSNSPNAQAFQDYQDFMKRKMPRI